MGAELIPDAFDKKEKSSAKPEELDAYLLDPAIASSLRNSGKVRKRAALSLFAGLTDFLAIASAFAIATFGYLTFSILEHLQNILLVTLPIYFAIAINNNAYSINALRKPVTSIQRSGMSFLFAFSAVLLVAFFLKASQDFSRFVFVMGVAGSFVFLALSRYGLSKLCKAVLGASPMSELSIFDGVDGAMPGNDYHIDAGTYGLHARSADCLNIQKLGHCVKGMDRVIVHCQPEFRDDWAHALKALDVNGEIVVPELTAIAPLSLSRRNGQISLGVSLAPLRWHQRLLKRTFDFAFAGAALIVLAVPMAVLALLIKIDSPGPIFFLQQRIGLGNRPFSIFKFRSMKVEQTDENGAVSASRDDDRVTKLGKFLRSSSADELPQLINVLRGDMSIVGPRPHAVGSTAEDQLFWDIDHRYWHRHSIKPGLTGLAQIRGYRGATEKRADLTDRLQSDLEYRSSWSLWGDIKIVLATFKVLVHKNAF